MISALLISIFPATKVKAAYQTVNDYCDFLYIGGVFIDKHCETKQVNNPKLTGSSSTTISDDGIYKVIRVKYYYNIVPLVVNGIEE